MKTIATALVALAVATSGAVTTNAAIPLANLHSTAVGVAYAEQEMGTVPTGPHDAYLDWIVTPKEAIRCGRGEGLRGLSGS